LQKVLPEREIAQRWHRCPPDGSEAKRLEDPYQYVTGPGIEDEPLFD
jgi:hypothetical protein